MEKRGGGLRFLKDLPVFIEEDHHEVGGVYIRAGNLCTRDLISDHRCIVYIVYPQYICGLK